MWVAICMVGSDVFGVELDDLRDAFVALDDPFGFLPKLRRDSEEVLDGALNDARVRDHAVACRRLNEEVKDSLTDFFWQVKNAESAWIPDHLAQGEVGLGLPRPWHGDSRLFGG